MNSSVFVFLCLAFAAANAGLLGGSVLQGPSARATVVGPDGSAIHSAAPGGAVVSEHHAGFAAYSAPVVHAAPIVHAAPAVVAAPAPLAYAAGPAVHHVAAPVVHHAVAPVVHHAAAPVVHAAPLAYAAAPAVIPHAAPLAYAAAPIAALPHHHHHHETVVAGPSGTVATGEHYY